MNIKSILSEPYLEIPFLNAGRGQGGYYVDQLLVHAGFVDELPEGLDAIIATADLQGRERFEESPAGAPRLLGEALPKRLADEILPELNCDPLKTGAILAVDFYTVPALDQRGGSGDVTKVWEAFGREFRWVAGVAGNHDTFGEALHPTRATNGNRHYLDGRRVDLDELAIAGLGGIIGNPRKPHRRTDEDYVDALIDLSDPPPDILITHDGPTGPQTGQRGSPRVTYVLNELRPPLVVRGHAHWDTPVVELAGGTQVLNVDCRVAILRRET